MIEGDPDQTKSSRASGEPQLWQGYIVPTTAAAPSSAVPVGELLMHVLRTWPYLLVCAAIFGALAYAATFALTPVYRSTVVFAVDALDSDPLSRSGQGQLGGLAGLAGLNLGQSDRTQEVIAVLQSRDLAERFIDEKGLKPLFFAERWDAERMTWLADEKPPTDEEAYLYFNQRVRSIAEDRRTGLVSLSITWRDPEAAAAWANELVALGNAQLRDRAIREAQRSLAFLERELERSAQVELRQSLYELMEAQKKQEMLANVREGFAFRLIDRARPSDLDRHIFPSRPLFAVAGVLLGGAFGLVLGLWRQRFRQPSTVR